MSICKYCHPNHPLDTLRRCPSCADAGDATRAGLHYGDYIARRGQPIRPVPVEAPPEPVSRANAIKTCRICGALIPPESPRRTLCSAECQAEYNRRSASEANAKAKAKRLAQPIPPRLCPICGKPVRVDRRRIYCDDDCAYKAARERERIYRANTKKGNVE